MGYNGYMRDWSKRVKCPKANEINTGLSSSSASFMVEKFGMPRAQLTADCAPVTSPSLKKLLVKKKIPQIGTVTGLKPAIESLERIMAKVKANDANHPGLFQQIGTAGMLCCRRIRRKPSQPIVNKPSNHSFGAAIDITINGKLDAVGDGMVQEGLLALYPYFREEGWYWGAEFSGPHEDAMHFEMAKETILRLFP